MTAAEIKENLIATIMQQPTAPLIVLQLQTLLEAERHQRAAFYEWLDEDKKAEFVNGKIMVHSPVVKEHNDASAAILNLISIYAEIHQLGYVGIEKLLISLSRNDYEPDVCFFRIEKSKDFKKGQLQFPAPDLVVEVLSKSSKRMINHDRVIKFDDYEKHGIEEYWIVDPELEIVEQYILVNGAYELQLKSSDGNLKSVALPGFCIPVRAIFDNILRINTIRSFLKV